MKEEKPRDNNKKAEEANTFFRTLINLNDVIHRIEFNRKRESPQEPQAEENNNK